VRSALLGLGILLLAAGMAGSAGAAEPTADELLRRPGPDVALIMGTSDYVPGSVRVSFLIVRADGKLIVRPRARVWVARGPDERPFAQVVARLEPLGVPGVSKLDGEAGALYVAHLRVPRPGKYRIVAEPIGAPIQGFQDLVVKTRSAAPSVGEKAYPSRTPTIASAKGDLAELTTSVPPDRALLRYSVADSIAAQRPFVLVFATPKYCTSRTCGPVVDVVDAVRRRYEPAGVRFIHVEIYEGNEPSLGPNRWVREWRLPSEPWVFLVGRDGRIKARFEGTVTTDELAAAVRANLL
jgi:hypothetical protein